ncbi:MAG: hypothetical protein RQ756_02370 [Flavobacteriaceae bacterium]|nr:hypothetical protein [Flavobacteriaceae bacterium]
MAKKNKYSYVAISFIVLVFGIYAIPKIIDSVQEGKVVKNNRSASIAKDVNHFGAV